MTDEQVMRYRRDPIAFLEDHYYIAKGRLIEIEDWQRSDFLLPLFYIKNVGGAPHRWDRPCPCGSGLLFGECCIQEYPRWYNEALVGVPKKNGKTEIASALSFYEFFFGDEPEVYFMSNSQTQTISLAFGKFRKAIMRNRALRGGLKIKTTVIENPANGGVATTLPHNPNTVAGLNPSLVHFDELWGFIHRDSVEVFNELTLSPARREALNLVTSYSGHRREGPLWDMYRAGRKGGQKRLFFYWSEKNKASWVDKNFLAERRARMPEVVFNRLHRNRWEIGGAFVTEEMIARARVPGLVYGAVAGGSVGLDLGLRHDRTVMARVAGGIGGEMVLADKAIWKGTRGAEVSIAEVEAALVGQFEAESGAHQCLCDPWQFAGSRQRLEGSINIKEFGFTTGNIQRLAKVLYEALSAGRFKFPADDEELAAELRGLQLIMTPTGYKFDHTSAGYSDQAVAIALAIYGELDESMARPVDEILAGIKGTRTRGGSPGDDGGDRDGGGVDSFSVLPDDDYDGTLIADEMDRW